jgi:hypothetical protein
MKEMAVKQHADPMKTKTGKQRLGPLNIKQLYELLEKESKAKNKGKIRSRIRILEKRGQVLPQEPVAETAPETV